MSTSPSEFLEKDSFARLLGIEISEMGQGQAQSRMNITENHLNGHGSVHGAVIFSLADVTFAAACNTEVSAIGVQTDIRYLAKPEGKVLLAQATQLSASRKLGNYQVDVSDEAGTLVARFSGTAYRF